MSEDEHDDPDAAVDTDAEPAAEDDPQTEPADAADGTDDADDGDDGEEAEAATEPVDPERAAKKAKADAVIAERRAKSEAVVSERKVNRRTVTSRRVTPRPGTKADAPASTSKARDAKKTESVVNRAPAPSSSPVLSKGPSPWWVPTLMFALLIVGALIIMGNYILGDHASNIRLVIGLGFILGGIVTATQYR